MILYSIATTPLITAWKKSTAICASPSRAIEFKLSLNSSIEGQCFPINRPSLMLSGFCLFKLSLNDFQSWSEKVVKRRFAFSVLASSAFDEVNLRTAFPPSLEAFDPVLSWSRINDSVAHRRT